MARYYESLGRLDDAIRTSRRALDVTHEKWIPIIGRAPDPRLNSKPRYLDLLRRIGLPY